MSVVLPNLDFTVTPAVVGKQTLYDFSTTVQTGVNPLEIVKRGAPKLQIQNESPVGMQIQLAQSLKKFNLPAGAWANIDLDADDKGFYWTPQYIMLTNPAVNVMLISYLPPGDMGTNITVLGNSPIQGATTVAGGAANFLQGIGQTKSLTEIDDLNPIGGGGFAVYDQNAILIPAGGTALHGQALELASKRLDGATEVGIAIAAGLVKIFNTLYSYNGIATAGQGQPIIVQRNFATGQISTAVQNIIVFTLGASNVHYRINHWLDVNNAVSPNNITWQCIYTDAATSAGVTVNMPLYIGTAAILIADGATARANNRFSGLTFDIWAKAATTVTIRFQDPTNTPNDSYSVVIEQLD